MTAVKRQQLIKHGKFPVICNATTTTAAAAAGINNIKIAIITIIISLNQIKNYKPERNVTASAVVPSAAVSSTGRPLSPPPPPPPSLGLLRLDCRHRHHRGSGSCASTGVTAITGAGAPRPRLSAAPPPRPWPQWLGHIFETPIKLFDFFFSSFLSFFFFFILKFSSNSVSTYQSDGKLPV